MKNSPMTLTQAIEGFLLEAHARRLSPGTISDYSNAFKKLLRFLDADPPMAEIDAHQVRAFMADLATPRAPAGQATREPRPLSKKTALNIHTGLSALWTWACGRRS